MESQIRSFKFRIYPSKVQEKQMGQHLLTAKNLWNELLEFSKQIYNDYGYFPTKDTLQLMVKNTGLFSQTQQEIAHRIFNSIIRVFKLRKQGKECGFPRFKNIDRMKSLHYPQAGFNLDKKLNVSPFGEIAIKKHREIEGRIKTLTLKRESSGKWFAIFCVKQEKKTPKENKGEAVGVDLGLKDLAVISDGTIIENLRCFKEYAEKLAQLQRCLSRKKQRGRNRKKAKLKVARLYEKISNTRYDLLHKTSTQLVNDHSLIALEELAAKGMSNKDFGLGRSINDAGWNMFANMIAYKAEEAGCKVVLVNPKNTTQECSNCHEIVKKDLTDRMHNCPFCGLSINRDLNAARNILIRATVGTTGSNASRDGTTVSSMKEDATRFIGW